MCKKVFNIYGCSGGYVAAIGAASAGSVLGTNLATKALAVMPGAGNAINATITYSLHQLEGRALIEFLEENADELPNMTKADAVAKFGTKLKAGLNIIENDTVKEYMEKAIDKALDIFL